MIQSAHERDSLVNDTKFLVLRTMLSQPVSQEPEEATHVRPVESSSLEMRRRSLNHDIRVQRRETLLGVVAICRRRPARNFLTTLPLAPENVSGWKT